MTTYTFRPARSYRGEGAKTGRGRGLIGKVCDYDPVGWDRYDPKVIRGSVIKAGSKVVITGAPDPNLKMAWIRDNKGNEQSVMRGSLTGCRRPKKGERWPKSWTED